MAIETAESALALIEAAEDKAESAPIMEVGEINSRPSVVEKWADSVDAAKKVEIDLREAWINPVDSSGAAAIKQPPTMTWKER